MKNAKKYDILVSILRKKIRMVKKMEFFGLTLFGSLGGGALMAVAAVIFVVGLVLVIKGGDWFVDSASWFAEATGIPKFVVGATVVVHTPLPSTPSINLLIETVSSIGLLLSSVSSVLHLKVNTEDELKGEKLETFIVKAFELLSIVIPVSAPVKIVQVFPLSEL